MEIGGIGTDANATPSSESVNLGSELGKDQFLKLLVAQLANQDPLDPMDNTEFVSQLSQFSSLEQLMGVNENLDLLKVAQQSMSNGQVAAMIGKEVEVQGGTLRHLTAGSAAIAFNLEQAAQTLTMRIRDPEGGLVRSIDIGSRPAGVATIAWDGKNSSGALVQPANYTLEFEAKAANGSAVNVSSSFSGVVTGVNFKDGLSLLEVSGTTVPLGDVRAIRDVAAVGGP